jgi:hypothetical protein
MVWIIAMVIAVYIFGGAITHGCCIKFDPYMDDADITIIIILWPLVLVALLIVTIMRTLSRFGE